MTRKAVFHDAGAFDDGTPIAVFPSAITSVFGRTGVVAAVAGDYFGAMPAALTGATQAARFVGATTSGAPVSGTFAVGDVVVARDGKVWVCTTLGSPGTWTDVGGGASVSYATPAIVLGSAAAAGAASTVIRSDSTIAAFDTTAPSTQAFGDAAAIGTAAFAARRDHKHAMPAAPTTIGRSQLIYGYTVAGSDKASIDTGADTADAGDNVWTGGDLLEVFFVGRTDEVATQVNLDWTINNVTSGYDRQFLAGANATASAGNSLNQAAWALSSHGSGGLSGQPGTITFSFANYLNTTFNKAGLATFVVLDSTAAQIVEGIDGVSIRATTAITRFKVAAQSTAKLKVGSQLLIYKRLSA